MAKTLERARAMILDASTESASEVRTALAKIHVDVVEWARSGIGWVLPWQKAKVELVVVDFMLTKRDGLYVVEKVHELDSACGIILTHSFEGWFANDIEIKAVQMGAGAALQRPFSEKRFLAVAQRLIGTSQKRRAPTRVKMG